MYASDNKGGFPYDEFLNGDARAQIKAGTYPKYREYFASLVQKGKISAETLALYESLQAEVDAAKAPKSEGKKVKKS